MNGFEKRAALKQKQIIRAAYDLFLKQGVKNTTMQMIAKSANVSQVTIYNYYESKDNVLYYVAQLFFEKYTREFEAIVYDASQSFEEKMNTLIEFEINYVKDLNIDLIEGFHTTKSSKMNALRAWYDNNRIYVGMEHLIREGKKEGIVNKMIDNESIILFIELIRGVGDRPEINNKKRLIDLFHLSFYGIGGKQS